MHIRLQSFRAVPDGTGRYHFIVLESACCSITHLVASSCDLFPFLSYLAKRSVCLSCAFGIRWQPSLYNRKSWVTREPVHKAYVGCETDDATVA
eukprot:s2577_g7.t1